MIVVDSSGWIEFFGDGPYADEFAKRLRQPATVITPTITIYEVYKWIKRERSEEEALQAIAAMHLTKIVELTEKLAMTAADISLSHGLPMADAIVLAVARANDAEIPISRTFPTSRSSRRSAENNHTIVTSRHVAQTRRKAS